MKFTGLPAGALCLWCLTTDPVHYIFIYFIAQVDWQYAAATDLRKVCLSSALCSPVTQDSVQFHKAAKWKSILRTFNTRSLYCGSMFATCSSLEKYRTCFSPDFQVSYLFLVMEIYNWFTDHLNTETRGTTLHFVFFRIISQQ